MADYGVGIGDIERAAGAIRGHVRRTPLIPSLSLSETAGTPVHLKLETLQDVGAFKQRGAANKILSLSDGERARGVVTYSTGNHGRAVAYMGKRLGTRAVVCMSELVPGNKRDAIAKLGAEIRIHGKNQDEAAEEAMRLVRDNGMILVDPIDDPWIIAGQGTIGLEIIEDLPDVATVLVPLSGGGLISGIALAIKARRPGCRIVGISMDRGAAMVESLGAGKPIQVEEAVSLADSLGGGIGLDNRYTFKIVRDLVDETILLTEREIADGMIHAFRREGLAVEGAGAVGMAALLHGKIAADGPVAVAVTGRNVDPDALLAVLDGSHVFGD